MVDRVSAGFSWFQHMKDITDITNIIAAANAAIDQRSQRSQSSRWILWLLAVASYGCFGLLTAETEADLQAQMGKQLSDGYNLLNAESVWIRHGTANYYPVYYTLVSSFI